VTMDPSLRRAGVFSLLEDGELEEVSGRLRAISLSAGEVLFREGDAGHDLYVLKDGRVAISIRLPDGADHEITQFVSGDFFGEMSIFDNAPRSATCRALEPAVLFGLSKKAFSDLIEDRPAIAIKLMYRMLNVTTQRLRNTSELVTDMVLWGQEARKRAVTDELTGAYNRRFLEDSMGNYVAEAEEKGEPLSLVMADLDNFRRINERYGTAKADEAIKEAVRVFRENLRQGDVVARFGGDEFVVVMPGTGTEAAVELAEAVRRGVSRLRIPAGPGGPVLEVSASLGVAGFPGDARDVKTLRACADAALYRAKEQGRDRVVRASTQAFARGRGKAPERKRLLRLGEKSAVISRILGAMVLRHRFLMLGHVNPDDDCIASMISFSLLLHLFYKEAIIYIGGRPHERFHYLLEICRYNSIRVLSAADPIPAGIDALVLCDTPKPSMIDMHPQGAALLSDAGVLRIEVDHHIGADSEYFGDEGFRLVTEASSASELIGHILLKLRRRKDLREGFQIADIFPRNLVLAILTGIIGDSNMGKFLKSERERRYYRIFSTMFNAMLSRSTVKRSNFFTMDEVYRELQKLSDKEQRCYTFMMDRKRFSGSVGYVALSAGDMEPLYRTLDDDTIVSTARAVADRLAEESSKLGLVAFYDNPGRSDLIQFRVRRSVSYKKFDLRELMSLLSIQNGGGHEGAIGFRVPRGEVGDFEAFIDGLVSRIEEALPA
jgi:diguanylate cyclase (GGDEF)-like protein